MPVNWNGNLLEHLPEAWAQAQRALLYGDALFETVRAFDGRLPLLERHWERLRNGLIQSGFALPPAWDAFFFEKNIRCVAPPNARIRLTVWRSAGGYYRPTDNRPQFLITAEALESAALEWPVVGRTLGVCASVRLPVDAYSNLKTFNSARYVAAAREAQARGWDDALVLNAFERVCEATASNVFWWEGDVLCTVPLGEGCVAGVMRAFVLETAAGAGLAISEKAVPPEALEAAEEIFLTNAVRGIQPVRIFAGARLPDDRTRRLFEHVQARLAAKQR
ncbi:MAG: aminotransferase class IV [Saprospiraceae bacterium]|nr:aminotransferase class IV [Saprospiraceae bacterium]MDW8228427.1 aminotransferase class IV [Saprospiraceae bacterium]